MHFKTSTRSSLAALLSGVLAISAILCAGPAAAQQPQSNEAIFWADINETGTRFAESFTQEYHDLSTVSSNDKFSSARMGDYARALAFENAEYGGACITFSGRQVGGATGDYPDLRAVNAGLSGSKNWNDRISSLVIRDGRTGSTCVQPATNEVVFWQNADYGGAQFRALTTDDFRNLKNVKFPGGGNWNDSISSIRVGGDASIMAFEDADFGGKCFIFEAGDYNNLTNQNTNLTGSRTWNDRISSMMVIGGSGATCPPR